MKKFLIHITLTSLIGCLILLGAENIYYHMGWFENRVNGWEVYAAIRQSKKKHKKVKKLIIGDSVGMQMYPCDREYDDMVSLTCNQAVTFAGYYFLLNNYIQANENNLPDTIITLINPLTLGSNLETYGFHYFLKPFYKDEYREHIVPVLEERIAKIPHHSICQWPVIRSTNYTPAYNLPRDGYTLIAPITDYYLGKMQKLADAYRMPLIIISVPIREDRKIEIEDKLHIALSQGEFQNKEWYEQIVSTLQYRSVIEYRDPVHFKAEYVPQDYIQ